MEASDLTALWLEFKANGNREAREALIAHYSFLVRHLVSRVLIGLPAHVEGEELLSYATMGLLDAMDRFDPERGVRFETYAGTRIKGAILDGMRANDWISRFTRNKIKQMERTYSNLTQKLGREPADKEMCEALEISLPEYLKLQQNASTAVVFSLDETIHYDDGDLQTRVGFIEDPDGQIDTNLMKDDEKSILADAIGKLPEREQILISLYYYEGLTLKEIGSVLGVTESRVSQMHSKAVLRLRASLVKEYESDA